MLARVNSCAVIGLEGVIVEVEVDSAQGLPGIDIVGLPDKAVQESRSRVQTAIKNAGLKYPRQRIVVNLAPASVRKEGPTYDLPIAVGVLLMQGLLPPHCLDDAVVVGELSLEGTVRHSRGVLPMAASARELGYRRIFVPVSDAIEAALLPEIQVYPVSSLAQLFLHLTGQNEVTAQPHVEAEGGTWLPTTDFREIKGQEHVKRALEIAAAGGHNVIMVGPPGAGKTLLARAMPGVLPEMSVDEALEVTRIYSVADALPPEMLIRTRPFRAPHHTISHAGLVGGGNWPHPGEISLAHRGVLFLDELPEFGTRVLEVMRQPIEDKLVTISRAQGSLTFPANFMLVAAMNPCPCGYYGDLLKACTCAPSAVTKYQKRISGPLLDRIDIHVEVPRVEYQKLSDDRLGEASSAIRGRVEAARRRQRERFDAHNPSESSAGEDSGNGKSSGRRRTAAILTNADMQVGEIRKYCKLDAAGEALVRAAMGQMNLSARGYHRVLKLARTIADLAGSEKIEAIHLAEALQYRPKSLAA
jgi:magnesium chelatase family protein